MRVAFIPYALVLLAFVVSLPFLNSSMQMSSSSLPATGFATASQPQGFDAAASGNIVASYSNGGIYVSVSEGLVWGTGYYYDYVLGKWAAFSFKEGDGWIKGQASATVRASGLRPGTNYVAVYTCTRIASEWKCGCLSETDCNHWFTQNFYVSND
jgi:hypothetical protein